MTKQEIAQRIEFQVDRFKTNFPDFNFEFDPYCIRLDSYRKDDSFWATVFVKRADGASIGRITFHDDKIYYWKSYKKPEYPLDATDSIWFRLERYFQTKEVVSQSTFDELYKRGLKIREDKIAQVYAIRATLPIKKRKAVQGPHMRPILTNLFQELFDKFNGSLMEFDFAHSSNPMAN